MDKQSVLATIGLTLFAIVVGIVFWYSYKGDVVTDQGVLISNEEWARLVDSRIKAPNETALPETSTSREVMITNGVKHSVPIHEIVAGGPARDGIPSIDAPTFVSIEKAEEFLDDNEPGIAVALDGINRFYPFQILVWHEIVNDTFNDRRVLVTYCPLCRSGIVFDPVVFTERVEFGTSGRLWNSNLVMYDRKTESLWPQVLGEAVVGEATGQTLPVLPSDQVRFGAWKRAYPDGEVLSRRTGVDRQYGYDPYGEDYYNNPGIFFPVNYEDNRLAQKELVFGIVVDGAAKAYSIDAIPRTGEVEDTFGDKTFVLRYDDELNSVRIYERIASEEGERRERVNPFITFWFAWVAAHPDTDLYF